MPIPTFDQLLVLLDRIGICGIALFFLLIHMTQEEITRQRLAKALRKRQEKEDE